MGKNNQTKRDIKDKSKKSMNQPEETKPHLPDFHGAAVIDEDGKEIPITEEMVQDACQKLDNEER